MYFTKLDEIGMESEQKIWRQALWGVFIANISYYGEVIGKAGFKIRIFWINSLVGRFYKYQELIHKIATKIIVMKILLETNYWNMCVIFPSCNEDVGWKLASISLQIDTEFNESIIRN